MKHHHRELASQAARHLLRPGSVRVIKIIFLVVILAVIAAAIFLFRGPSFVAYIQSDWSSGAMGNIVVSTATLTRGFASSENIDYSSVPGSLRLENKTLNSKL